MDVPISTDDFLSTRRIRSIINNLIKQTMPTKKTPPKKEVKKDSMSLPEKNNLVFKKTGVKSYDGKRHYPTPIEDCCEKAPDTYDRDAELMSRAAQEIKGLRDHNRHMTTRLDMFDKMYNLFTNNNNRYGNDGCMSDMDIASRLEYRAAERKEEAKSKS